MNIKTNTDFDLDFTEVEKQLINISNPKNFERIYDLAKRFIKKFGFDARAIESIYLLGYIDGKRDNSSKKSNKS